ncbi:hypothetical protein Kpol_160p2 [Vanderwaltozyma polyspora DSM 70294]|uniref:Uncharacterized protein n=1 Tax=Vanderwaltozyma polyspora (strain ATCC 22028 / DSM 70294 / BCRC 21397 / CBS 2163 / NBRC 10782 / NRRL Y-8283 / UCD 57-17) TaxID=436907 RepID=A7TTU6_VANPO|nr:uncharacterized protein Kpol_160p2 [Vanderwaltozyma polyspora DSM 70294]EDO14311.1 hypothetical protein Kpol_160p2 [Vanderwaltozyma polyspora DSM 70294]
MGVILSCCRGNDNDENEGLLAGQQAGYGGIQDSIEEDDLIMQRKLLEQEQKTMERNQELKDIVINLNDKLIDISMISNSGIVIQSTDLDQLHEEGNENVIVNDTEGEIRDNIEGQKTEPTSHLKTLDTKQMPPLLKDCLKKIHTNIFEDLNHQLKIESSESLVITL